MWRRFREWASRRWRGARAGSGEGRAAEERARFWAEVREGQREAEARSRP